MKSGGRQWCGVYGSKQLQVTADGECHFEASRYFGKNLAALDIPVQVCRIRILEKTAYDCCFTAITRRPTA